MRSSLNRPLNCRFGNVWELLGMEFFWKVTSVFIRNRADQNTTRKYYQIHTRCMTPKNYLCTSAEDVELRKMASISTPEEVHCWLLKCLTISPHFGRAMIHPCSLLLFSPKIAKNHCFCPKRQIFETPIFKKNIHSEIFSPNQVD